MTWSIFREVRLRPEVLNEDGTSLQGQGSWGGARGSEIQSRKGANEATAANISLFFILFFPARLSFCCFVLSIDSSRRARVGNSRDAKAEGVTAEESHGGFFLFQRRASCMQYVISLSCSIHRRDRPSIVSEKVRKKSPKAPALLMGFWKFRKRQSRVTIRRYSNIFPFFFFKYFSSISRRNKLRGSWPAKENNYFLIRRPRTRIEEQKKTKHPKSEKRVRTIRKQDEKIFEKIGSEGGGIRKNECSPREDRFGTGS